MTAPVGIGWRHPHYGEVLESLPPVDFLEVHSENFFGDGGAALAVLEQGRGRYPVSLHGVGLALGSAAGLDPWHLERLALLVDRIDPMRVSDHACFARAPSAHGVVHASDLLPIPFNAAALDVLCANVQQVQERLRRTILVENLSAYVRLPGDDRGEPEFFAGLARRTGCQLLLDVNNLYVNALNAQRRGGGDPLMACVDWMDRLPVDAVGELHVAGHCVQDDLVIDDHGSRVAPPVWQLQAHARGRFGPVPTLVEWDTDLPALDVLLAEADRAREPRSVAA
jgi:uncharacterized protein (UPF0276 family)